MNVLGSYLGGVSAAKERNALEGYLQNGPEVPYSGDNSGLRGAFSAVESGGRYDAVGPDTGKGRAYGKYQVMDFNIGPWTEAILGRRMSVEEFLANPQAQDAVFDAKMREYTGKYGTVQDAASMWFSGRPYAGNNASDGYLTVPQYVAKVMGGM